MRRASKGYTRVDIPLFPTMLVQGPILQGKGSTVSVDSITHAQPSSPTYTNVADEVTFTSVYVVHGGAATTVSSIDAGQGSGNIPRSPTMPRDSPLPGGHTPGSDEGSMTLHELTVLCTKLSNKVDNLETELKQTKQTYGATLTKLIKKVKKLEQTVKTSQARRRAKIVVLDDEERVLSDAKVLADATKKNVNTYTRRKRAVSTGSEGVNNASRIFSTVEESVSTVGASMPVSTAGMVQQVNIIIPTSSETTKDKEEQAKFNAEQEELLTSNTTEDEANPPVGDINWDDVQAQIQVDEDLAQKLLEEERENLSIEERARLLAELIDKKKKLQAAQRYEAIRNKPQTIQEMFNNVYKQVNSFVPMDSVMEKERTKRAGLNLQEESSKRQKTREGSEPTKELKSDEISQEDLQKMIIVVPVEEVFVEALQKFDRDDLDKLWSLVKERFSSTDPTDDKERTLCVELKRLFEPDTDDIL
ncbi:hypothetical protein Tco_1099938 [Tanacetum coccineum]